MVNMSSQLSNVKRKQLVWKKPTRVKLFGDAAQRRTVVSGHVFITWRSTQQIIPTVNGSSKEITALFLAQLNINTVESWFFQSPREMEIGSKNQEFKKSKVVVHHTCFTTHGTVFSVWETSRLRTGLSKVASCRRKSQPTWLVLPGYSAWHFFTDGVF